MASNDRSKVYLLGPGTLTLDGVNVGHVEDGKLALEFEQVEATVGKYASTPTDIFHLGTKAKFEAMLDQIDFPTYEKCVQGSLRIASGANEALGIGSLAGARLTAMELVFTPDNTEVSVLGVLTLWRVVPTENREIKWGKELQKMSVTFTALINESKLTGEKLGRFGNASVTQEAVAPTITDGSCVPVDDATGVSVSAAKTIAWSENMDADTISVKTVHLFADAGETGIQAPVAITVSHTAATTTITPVSNLTGSTKYELILSDWIKDAAGNRFAGAKRSFTTA